MEAILPFINLADEKDVDGTITPFPFFWIAISLSLPLFGGIFLWKIVGYCIICVDAKIKKNTCDDDYFDYCIIRGSDTRISNSTVLFYRGPHM